MTQIRLTTDEFERLLFLLRNHRELLTLTNYPHPEARRMTLADHDQLVIKIRALRDSYEHP